MRQLNYIKTTLFDSTLARFKLSVEARITKIKNTEQSNSIENLCYIDSRSNAILNPNIYLVFSYKGDTLDASKSLYMSYPQLFALRRAFKKVSNILLDECSFIEIEGMTTLKSELTTPIVISNIGKDSKFISFRPSVIPNEETGRNEPAVAILISGKNDEASVLTLDEFLTVQTIINDIDLSQHQINFALFSILYTNNNQPQQAVAPMQTYQQYSSQRPAVPRYNSEQPQRRTYQSTTPQVANNSSPSRTSSQPQNQIPVRREQKSLLSEESVKEAEAAIEPISWDSEDDIDSIFNEE